MDEKVDTIATTPMLSKVTFSDATQELASLQRQLQFAGWRLHNDTNWFDLTPHGLDQLRTELRNKSTGYVKTMMLRVPEKYAMTFRIYCAARCDSKIGLDRYLIDIGIGEDIAFAIQKRELNQIN